MKTNDKPYPQEFVDKIGGPDAVMIVATEVNYYLRANENDRKILREKINKDDRLNDFSKSYFADLCDKIDPLKNPD